MTRSDVLDELVDANGTLNVDRPLAAHELFVPAFITLDAKAERLRYFGNPAVARVTVDYKSGPDAPTAAAKTEFRVAVPRAGLLTDFVQLVEAPPSRILKYAKRWGVLELCAAHRIPIHARLGHDDKRWCEALSDPDVGVAYERVQDWRRYALMFRALLIHAADNDRRPRRGELAHTASFLCWLGDVGPRLVWRSGGMAFELASRSGLFGALAAQAAFFAAGSEGLAVCSSCGTAYPPRRRPVLGLRSYCEACRNDGAPLRDAQRDKRKREQEKRSRARRAKGGTG